jgi:hypothetical protein
MSGGAFYRQYFLRLPNTLRVKGQGTLYVPRSMDIRALVLIVRHA